MQIRGRDILITEYMYRTANVLRIRIIAGTHMVCIIIAIRKDYYKQTGTLTNRTYISSPVKNFGTDEKYYLYCT